MSDKIEIADIRRLEIRPGDRIVMKVESRLSSDDAARIRELWERFAGDTPVLILGAGMSLDVLSEAA